MAPSCDFTRESTLGPLVEHARSNSISFVSDSSRTNDRCFKITIETLNYPTRSKLFNFDIFLLSISNPTDSFSIISKHFIDSYEIFTSTCISRLSLNWIYRSIEFIYIFDQRANKLKKFFCADFHISAKIK